jgi:hypothetical protein
MILIIIYWKWKRTFIINGKTQLSECCFIDLLQVIETASMDWHNNINQLTACPSTYILILTCWTHTLVS